MYNYKEEVNPIIILLCGKARNGKSTVGSYIKENINKRAVQIQLVSTLKNYVKTYFGWDGSDESKPRELLQELGTEVIRKKLGKEKLFINRTIEDIDIMSHYFDIFIIDDIRLEIEINEIKKHLKNVLVVKIERPEYINELTSSQKKHLTETGLDNYNDYDYVIKNDGSLEDLKIKTIKFIESSEIDD